MNVSTAYLMDIFKEKGIRPSYIRFKVMEYLITKRSHPTADEIYNSLAKEIPTLSKTTVYNSLNAFVKAGLVRVITIGDNEAKYDADVSEHGHFKCEVCGRVYDFPAYLEPMQPETLRGFRVMQRDLYFKGVCPRCLRDK